MKHTIAQMKNLGGGQSSDLKIAKEFCQEALAEVKLRADVIEDAIQLRSILDAKVFADITAALGGIRHIALAVAELDEFLNTSGLAKEIKSLNEAVHILQDSAEEQFQWLQKLMPAVTFTVKPSWA